MTILKVVTSRSPASENKPLFVYFSFSFNLKQSIKQLVQFPQKKKNYAIKENEILHME